MTEARLSADWPLTDGDRVRPSSLQSTSVEESEGPTRKQFAACPLRHLCSCLHHLCCRLHNNCSCPHRLCSCPRNIEHVQGEWDSLALQPHGHDGTDGMMALTMMW